MPKADSIMMLGRIGDYLELTKFRLTLTAVGTAVLGFWMAEQPPVSLERLAHLFIGALLVGGGANALNQCLEHDSDLRMLRTANRPVPAKRISYEWAIFFAMWISVMGVAYLAAMLNTLTAYVAFLIILSYVFIYTPLKRITWLNTYVGALPGAMPILLGWAAGSGRLEAGAWALFVILFVWQLPHFFAIAWVYRDDYERGGFNMITKNDSNGYHTSVEILITSVLLTGVSVLPVYLEMTGKIYLWGALLLGGLLTGLSISLMVQKLKNARKFIGASIIYLLGLIAIMIMDKTKL